MKLNWKKEYSVKVERLDEQHKLFVSILNKLINALDTSQAKERLNSIIDELIKFEKIHFSTEEMYFNKYDYHEKEAHVKEHKKFIEKIESISKKSKNNELEVSFELVNFLEDWFIYHTTHYDKQYSDWFNEHGLK